jgi:hypothetical protein
MIPRSFETNKLCGYNRVVAEQLVYAVKNFASI